MQEEKQKAGEGKGISMSRRTHATAARGKEQEAEIEEEEEDEEGAEREAAQSHDTTRNSSGRIRSIRGSSREDQQEACRAQGDGSRAEAPATAAGEPLARRSC